MAQTTANAHGEPEVVISVRDLVKRFRSSAGRWDTVLDGVSFDVYRGETVVLMGGSGCGKSTVLNCLIGELVPEAGKILLKTREMAEPADIVGMQEDQLNAIRRRFGILFQSGALFNSMTVAENVSLPLIEHSDVDSSIIDIVVTLKLEQVKMLEHRSKMPAQLSGGQKKRAGLARGSALYYLGLALEKLGYSNQAIDAYRQAAGATGATLFDNDGPSVVPIAGRRAGASGS